MIMLVVKEFEGSVELQAVIRLEVTKINLVAMGLQVVKELEATMVMLVTMAITVTMELQVVSMVLVVVMVVDYFPLTYYFWRKDLGQRSFFT